MLRVVNVGQVEEVPVFIKGQSLYITDSALHLFSLGEAVAKVREAIMGPATFALFILDVVILPSHVLNSLIHVSHMLSFVPSVCSYLCEVVCGTAVDGNDPTINSALFVPTSATSGPLSTLQDLLALLIQVMRRCVGDVN